MSSALKAIILCLSVFTRRIFLLLALSFEESATGGVYILQRSTAVAARNRHNRLHQLQTHTRLKRTLILKELSLGS